MSSRDLPKPTLCYVALTGNPNCGKTTIFNALTGLRAKVANYAGVTVERREGRLRGGDSTLDILILDLPGSYSLSPKTQDEEIARDVLFQRLEDVPAPSAVIVVTDASNLHRNLYYATQVIELGYPTVLALNMMDVARQNGLEINVGMLETELGVPVVPLVASKGEGIAELKARIEQLCRQESWNSPKSFCPLQPSFEAEIEKLDGLLKSQPGRPEINARVECLLMLADEKVLSAAAKRYSPDLVQAVREARGRLEQAGADWRTATIEARYGRIGEICNAAITRTLTVEETFSDRLDRILTHKVWGMLIFLAMMALIFQSIFNIARVPMEWLSEGIDWLGRHVESMMPAGALNDLLVNGVISGVGAVVVFLPQILLLFLFICLLEDSGYMARAAFIMDRIMSKVGLHGKSFIPLLSSYACAIPGILSTRTIENPKDRLATILVAPLMSCSARLPVYTVLIGACVPEVKVLGVFKLPGLTLLAMYLLGTIAALIMAWVFKSTFLKSPPPLLIMELPPYKRPLATVVLRHMWDRSKVFLTQAGTVILGINIILWFLASYPKQPSIQAEFDARRAEIVRQAFPGTDSPEAIQARLAQLRNGGPDSVGAPDFKTLRERLGMLEREEASARLQHSFAGLLGRIIEPVIEPLGFDWKIGIGIISSFAAREVFVSTMSVVYNVGEESGNGASASLVKVMKEQRRPDGRAVFTPLTTFSLMIFYVFALQCASTVAVVRRETNSWKWPIFQWLYLGILAWVMAFLTYHGGQLLGFH